MRPQFLSHVRRWCKHPQRESPPPSVLMNAISPSKWTRRVHTAARFLRIMPQEPDPPPAKRFKPGSPFFRLDKKPGMLLPRAGHAPISVDAQRRQLPIYQAKSQLINQLRQLHNAVIIGRTYDNTYVCDISVDRAHKVFLAYILHDVNTMTLLC